MQDRFKFRIWHKPEKKMMLFNNPTLIDGKVSKNTGGLLFKSYDHNIKDVHECKPQDFHIMQCTGLKDKSGKPIFEGDILKVEDICRGKIYSLNMVVYWKETEYRVKGDYHTTAKNPTVIFRDWSISCFMDNSGVEAEVIGNIYQNPELLEA